MLAGKNSAVFAVDGVVVDRWSLESSGGFRGSRLLSCQKAGQPPNLRPQSFTISCNGEPIESAEFAAFGLNEAILLFDLANGTNIDPNGVLEPNREYALICDPDMRVPEVQFVKTKQRSAYRLNRPLTQATQLLCGDAGLWEPHLSVHKTQQQVRVALESAANVTLEIGSRSHIMAVGIPEDAISATLFVHTTSQKLVRSGGVWTTTETLFISPELVTGNLRVRVRVGGPDYIRTVVPSLKLNLTGIAMRHPAIGGVMPSRWQIPKNGILNRASGDAWARVFDLGEFKLRDTRMKKANGTGSLYRRADSAFWWLKLNVS